MVWTLFFRMIFRKFSEITKNKPIFIQHNIFYNYEYFFYQSAFWSLFNHRERSQSISNNVVCVVAHLVFLFCCALTTSRCNAFQHNFVNQKKSEFYGTYFQTMLFLVTMVWQISLTESNIINLIQERVYTFAALRRKTGAATRCVLQKFILKHFEKIWVSF